MAMEIALDFEIETLEVREAAAGCSMNEDGEKEAPPLSSEMTDEHQAPVDVL